MVKRWFTWLIVLLAGGLLFSPPTPALAAGSPPGDDGVVVWNEDYTLEENGRLTGDLVVFNGDATLEAGSRVEGSVIIWQGSAQVDGTVERDLVVSGGDVNLGDRARVRGDVVCTWNCDLEQAEGARVDGRIVESGPLRGLRIENWGNLIRPQVPSLPRLWAAGPRQVLQWVFRAIRSVVAILVIAAVAGLVALIWPHQMAQVGRAAVKAPWPSLGIGLLTVAAAVVLILVLAITICLSPAGVLLALVLSAAGLFGWIAIGEQIGERLLQALKAREIAPLWAAGMGTFVITLVGMGLSAAFCLAPLGWLIIAALGCAGLGAVVLTRFGTLAYAPSVDIAPSGTGTPPQPPLPPPPPPSPETPTPPEEAGGEEA